MGTFPQASDVGTSQVIDNKLCLYNSGIRRMWAMCRSAATSDQLVVLLLGSHVGHQVADTVAVCKLVVVPD